MSGGAGDALVVVVVVGVRRRVRRSRKCAWTATDFFFLSSLSLFLPTAALRPSSLTPLFVSACEYN